MELEVRQRFAAIEAILQSVAESQKASAAAADARMDRMDARIALSEDRASRMEARLDKRMDGIAKLIQTGMKLIVRIEARQEKTEMKLGEVTEKLDALITVVDGVVKRPGSGPR